MDCVLPFSPEELICSTQKGPKLNLSVISTRDAFSFFPYQSEIQKLFRKALLNN
ncbi:hypothetical protein ACRRTK_009729 [Alexandromys fortis]